MTLTPAPLSREREMGTGRGERGEGVCDSKGLCMRNVPPYLKELRRQFRTQSTPSEAHLWKCLRRSRLGGFKFRRQHPIGRFVVDFCCVRKRLIIELDGDVHNEELQSRYDLNRDEILQGLGYRILRFRNEEVASSLDSVLARILEALKKCN
jgi:very-short-patch-repair endonuclease